MDQSVLNHVTYTTLSTPYNNSWTQDSGIGSWFPSQKCPSPISPEKLKPCKLNFDLSDDKGYEDDVETFMKRSLESVKKNVDDMQPEDDKRYEYSYRPSDMIKFYYAGPSHWKLMKSIQPEQKTNFMSHKKLLKIVTLNDVMKIEEDSIKITDEDICMKRVKKRKSILPLVFKIPNNIFDLYENASPDYCIRELTQEENIVPEFEECEDGFIETESQNYVADHNDFMDNTEQGPSIPTSKTERFGRLVNISTASIINQQCNRKVDIQKVRKLSMLVFENELSSTATEVRFNEVCTKVNKLCENSCDTSCALIFFSLLQEAAEKKISLSPTETINDFDIKPYQSDHCMTI